MILVPADLKLPFEVTFDSSILDVAMRVFEIPEIGSPSLVSGPSAMDNVYGYTYVGQFTPLDNKSYLIHKAVYTDGTFATLHPDYSQSSETITAIDLVPISQIQLGPPDMDGDLFDNDDDLSDC